MNAEFRAAIALGYYPCRWGVNLGPLFRGQPDTNPHGLARLRPNRRVRTLQYNLELLDIWEAGTVTEVSIGKRR